MDESVLGTCNRENVDEYLSNEIFDDENPNPAERTGAWLFTDGGTTFETGAPVTFRLGKWHPHTDVDTWEVDFGDFEDDTQDEYAREGGTGALPTYESGDEETVSFEYSEPGTYTAELSVFSEDGYESTAQKTVTIEDSPDEPPAATISAPSEGETVDPAGTLDLDASASTAGDDPIAAYEWRLFPPSGGTGTAIADGETASVDLEDLDVVDDVGRYDLRLLVTDEADRRDVARSRIDVGGLKAAFALDGGGETVHSGAEITLDASSSDYLGDGAVDRYEWSGDVSGSGQTLTTTVGERESLEVTLTVESGEESASTTRTFPVEDADPPVARISPSRVDRNLDESVEFDASDSYDPDGDVLSYEWRVDGGSWESGSAEFETSFSTRGNHSVSVRVTDADGASATAEGSVSIDDELPEPDFVTYRCHETDRKDRCTDKEYTNEITTTGNDGRPNEWYLWLDATPSSHPNDEGLHFYWENLHDEATDRFDDASDDDDHPSVVRLPYEGLIGDGLYDRADAGQHEVTLRTVDFNGDEATITKTVEVVPYVELKADDEVPVGESTGVRVIYDTVFGEYSEDRFEVRRLSPEPVSEPPTVREEEYTKGRNVTFHEPGTYRIRCTVYDRENGVKNTDTTTVTVEEPEIEDGPVASLSASEMTVLRGESVVLDASDSEDGAGTTTYDWSVENVSAEDPVSAQPSGERDEVAFERLGEHEVSVTLTDENGATDSATVDVIVVREPEDGGPKARIDRDPTSAVPDQIVWFDGRRSYAEAGIESYEWLIDLGSSEAGTETLTGPQVSTTFPDNNYYKAAELTVTDANGNTDTTDVRYSVYEGEDNAGRIDVSPEIPHAGEPVTFDASDSFSENGIDSYNWSIEGARSGAGVTHTTTFEEPGTYVATLELYDRDDEGLVEFQNVAQEEVVVAPAEPPTADLSLSATELTPNDELTLDASGSSDDEAIQSYKWTVRQTESPSDRDPLVRSGEVATVSSWPEWTGTFEVELTVTDVTGVTATATETITVSSESPIAEIDGPEETETGVEVTFDASESTDPDGGEIEHYEWRIQDYSAVPKSVDGPTTLDHDGGFQEGKFPGWNVVRDTGVEIDHVFERASEYQVRLTVTDDEGDTTIATTKITVSTASEQPEAVVDGPEDPVTGTTVTFDGSHSSDPDGGAIERYEWTITGEAVDGELTATGATVEHAFEDDGEFDATLTVTDDEGETATTTASGTVTIAPIDGTVPQDLNGDGNYRDVNGDGDVSNGDVVDFFANQHVDPWDSRPDLFDFDGDGDVGQSDVVELFRSVSGQ